MKPIMALPRPIVAALAVCIFIGLCSVVTQCSENEISAKIVVDASLAVSRKIPDTLFGVFFEEINHAGAGGLWAELVSNRGFEAGDFKSPSNIDPWGVIGDDSVLTVSTELSSCLEHNKVALRMNVLCGSGQHSACPAGGVGVYNPGFWGMNIAKGKNYEVVFYVRSSTQLLISVALTDSTGRSTLASKVVKTNYQWKRVKLVLKAKGTDDKARLQVTTMQNGSIWLDQVSVMPMDTYKGHGFRTDLFKLVKALKPRFLRFSGGRFVEGAWLRNAVRWKETVGPWENRPGHFGDVWNYWTDDGIGYLEFLQLSEDLGAAPVWVFNNGISRHDEVDPSAIEPFLKEALDGIEFARGNATSNWGKLRASLGHPEPFDLRYVAVGNEDCGKKNYRANYFKFFNAIRAAYPDIQIISNCDASSRPLDHPSDIYDFHVYASANGLFSMTHKFDHTSRNGPKAFVSEFAVHGRDAGRGSLLASLAEAAFLLGLEMNSDVVAMASYAPLFVNVNDRTWNPDAIVFNSSKAFGTPSYWMQRFFTESSGATIHETTIPDPANIVATAISYKNSKDKRNYLRTKIVNFESSSVHLNISVYGLDRSSVSDSGSTITVMTSRNVMDENSFSEPMKVMPRQSKFVAPVNGGNTKVVLAPHSFTSIDLLKESK